MTETKREGQSNNMPLFGLGLVVAAGVGLAAGYAAWGSKPAEEKKDQDKAKPTATTPAETPAEGVARQGAGEAAGGAAATPAAATGPASATACADYSTKLCAVAGEQSETCGQIKALSGMMPATACQAGIDGIAETETLMKSARQSCDDLQSRLCNDLGQDSKACQLVKEQTPRFPADRCKMMIESYESVLKELRCMEMQDKPLTPELLAKLVEGTGPAFGPADAKVTLVEFSDFQCPYCSMAAQAAEKIRTRYADFSVRFLFRQFPLSFHDQAEIAAEGAMAAHAQNKFWEYHDQVFAAQRELNRAKLEQIAEGLSLDMVAFRAALDNNTFKSVIEADMKLGEELCVNGTPSLFLNGTRVQNPTDANAISNQIDALLQAAGMPTPPPLPPPAPPAEGGPGGPGGPPVPMAPPVP